MVLMSTGEITAEDLASELSIEGQISIEELYNNDSKKFLGARSVPKSGQIKFSDFYGASKPSNVVTSSTWVSNMTTAYSSGTFSSNFAQGNFETFNNDGAAISSNTSYYVVPTPYYAYANTTPIMLLKGLSKWYGANPSGGHLMLQYQDNYWWVNGYAPPPPSGGGNYNLSIQCLDASLPTYIYQDFTVQPNGQYSLSFYYASRWTPLNIYGVADINVYSDDDLIWTTTTTTGMTWTSASATFIPKNASCRIKFSVSSTSSSSIMLCKIGVTGAPITAILSGSGSDQQYLLAPAGISSVANQIYIQSFIQYATSFTSVFEIKTNGSADALFFFCGSTSIPTNEDIANSGYMVIFCIYSEFSGGAGRSGAGIYLRNSSNTIVASAPYSSSSAWRKVIISYQKGTTSTWVVNLDGADVLVYSDSANTTWLGSSGGYWGIGARNGSATADFMVRKLNLGLQGMPAKPPITSGLVGYYTADSLVGTSWKDMSGSGNHATTTGVNRNNGGINGQDYLYGDTSSRVNFPAAILPSTYTLFHVCRYNGQSKERILTSPVGQNWLSGFHTNKSGVAYHSDANGWITSYANTNFSLSDWLFSSDQKNLYRGNKIDCSIGTPGGQNATSIGINNFHSTEYSDWACACIIVYNRALSLAEINTVEDWMLLTYKIQLVYPVSALTNSTTAITNKLYGNGTYTASASSIWGAAEDAKNAFDDNKGTQWTDVAYNLYLNGNYTGSVYTTINSTNHYGEWLQIEMPNPILVRGYTFRTHALDADRMHKSWIVAASSNGSTWTAIDTRSNQTTAMDNIYTYYIYGNTQKYKYYRIVVKNLVAQGANVNAWCTFVEFKFLEGFSQLALSPYYYYPVNPYYHYPFDGSVNEVIRGVNATNYGGSTVSDYVSFPNNTVNLNAAQSIQCNTTVNPYAALTLSLRFNASALPGALSVVLSMFPVKLYIRTTNSTCKIYHNLLTSTAWHEIFTNYVVQTNKWIHWVLTYENVGANGVAKVYIDGTLDTTYNSTGNTTQHYGFGIGTDGFDRAFKGSVDDLLVFDRVLTSNEIQKLYSVYKIPSPLPALPSLPVVSGGTVTTSGSSAIHSFTSSGTFVVYDAPVVVDILLVGGGGGSGGGAAGGGGAGGVVYKTNYTIPEGVYTITIGDGGSGGVNVNSAGSNGGNTTFGSLLTALGGGGGGGDQQNLSGLSGGSGGGNSAEGGDVGGVGSALQPSHASGGYGNAGGGLINSGPYHGSGGGGGAGGAGGQANGNIGGSGGNGIQINITGTPTYYGGGGAGGCLNASSVASGGLGGGGNSGQNGSPNTGGGGGGHFYKTDGYSSSGGSGIVIIKRI